MEKCRNIFKYFAIGKEISSPLANKPLCLLWINTCCNNLLTRATTKSSGSDCDNIGACRAMSDNARSQIRLVGRFRLVYGGPRQFFRARARLNQLGNVMRVTEFTAH